VREVQGLASSMSVLLSGCRSDHAFLAVMLILNLFQDELLVNGPCSSNVARIPASTKRVKRQQRSSKNHPKIIHATHAYASRAQRKPMFPVELSGVLLVLAPFR
jgi:hypothetical protein